MLQHPGVNYQVQLCQKEIQHNATRYTSFQAEKVPVTEQN
jgi:hypothetical protein